MKNLILKIINFVNTIIPKSNNQILFTSYPDMSDNSYAFYEYMQKYHSDAYTFIWLVESNFSMDNSQPLKNTKIVSKKSFLGFYYYCRSKYIFFTHGLYNGIKHTKKQIVTNLWHGMPLKNIGYLDNKSEFPEAHFTIATSPVFQKIMSQAFHQELKNVLLTGQPRDEYLLHQNKDILLKFGINQDNYEKVIAWLPTYRKSNFGDIRNDGELQELLPLVNNKQLLKLNAVFQEHSIFCFIKLHPMDTLSKSDFDAYSNIKVLTNDDFNKTSTQLYSFLANTDALITDYSSVYIDYMLTRKPIAFVIPDINSYADNRGFTFDNVIEHLPGTIVQTYTELESFIAKLSDSNVSVEYLENGLYEFYHSVDNDFSANIYTTIFKKGTWK